MSHQCAILDQAAQPTLSIRTRTSVQGLRQVLGQSYGAIAQYLGELGEHPAGPPFAAYHNMDMANLDVEIGFPVPRKVPGRGNILAGEIPAGKYASCLYTGPYNEIGPGAYEALSAFVGQSGYEATGVSYEMYLNDPNETPPQELQTQVLFPLRTS
ncbi:MAG: GyrI-like domain-containing protein [Sphingomonadaceae bacterium]